MADIYLRSSDGDDADDGSTWALAKATLQAALTAAGAGGTVWMDDDHSESFAVSVAFTSAGTIANPTKIICVVTDTTTPVTTYPSSSNIVTTTFGDSISFLNDAYYYGVYFNPYDGIKFDVSGRKYVFENCRIKDFVTDGLSGIGAGSAGNGWVAEFIDCDMDDVNFEPMDGVIRWLGGTYLHTGTAWTNLVESNASSTSGELEISGVDLSAFAGTNLYEGSLFVSSEVYVVNITNCIIPSGVVYVGTAPVKWQLNFNMDACHTADGYYTFFSEQFAGRVQDETTIKRQGGASYDGTNEYSANFTTNANALEALGYIRYSICSLLVDATIQKTLTVHITYDSATLLYNDDVWIEAKYHDATNEALGKWERTKVAVAGISTPDRTAFTDVSGSETWDGISGWTNPQEETIEVDITGGNGLVEVYVCVAKPSITVYVDPDVQVS